MIQRIQSFLLVLAACGAALCLMFPVALYAPAGEDPQMALYLLPHSNDAIAFIQIDWILTVLMFLIGIISLVSIFLYKNRIRQMRVVTVNVLLSAVYIALTLLYSVDHALAVAHLPGNLEPNYSIGSYIPMVMAVLLIISQRCIRADEMKVRAADRIR